MPCIFQISTSTPGWLRYVNNYFTFTDIGTSNPHTRLQGIEYQNGWEFGQHKIIAGLEWHKSKASNVLNGYDTEITTKSFYLQDTISLGDKWTLIPGVRYDYSDKLGKNWSPQVAANYRPDHKTKFYATWGRSYNVPLLNELYSQRADEENLSRIWNTYPIPGFTQGFKNLSPEKGYSAIVGIEHDINEKAGLTFNFFQNRLKNALAWNDGDSSESGYSVRMATNYLPLKSHGVELTFRQKIDDHFGYNLGYSHTHTHMQHPESESIPFYRPQPNGYRLGLSYNNRGLKMNLQGVMASGISTTFGQQWSNDITLQSYPKRRYAVLDFNLSYDLNDSVTFYFKALNFTNQHYSNEESIKRSWNDYKEFTPAPGRQFVYGMNVKF